MLRSRRILTVAILAVVNSALSFGCTGASSSIPAGDTITIGIDFPLSGADASDGVPTANAVKLAVKDANDNHLVAGFTLATDVRDDTVGGLHNPVRGVDNFNAFLADPTDLGVVGPLNSNVADAVIPLSNEHGLALVSPANTTAELTKGPHALALRKSHPLEISYFRICPTDDVQGSAGATFAYKILGARRAYVMDDDATFGRGLSDQWASEFRSEGGIILGHDHERPGQTEFREMIASAAAAGPDIVFFGGESSTGAAVTRKEMAGTPLAHVPYASGDGIQNQQFLDVAGPEADNSYATVAAANAAELPTAAKFLQEYQSTYHHPAGPYSASGYVAAMVLVHAIAASIQANGGTRPTREQVLEQLRATTNFNSILGVFSFDQNGDTTLKIVSVWTVKNKRWTFLTQRDFK